MKTKNSNDTSPIVIVQSLYIKGGKNVVKYDTITGNCWIENISNDTGKTTILKEYKRKLD